MVQRQEIMKQESSLPKLLITAFILSLLFLSSSVLLTMYQQHVLIGKDTNFGDIRFGNGTVIIKGHQSQLSQNDIVSVGGRDYIKLTGKQVSVSGNTYSQAIRTLSTTFFQNLLFEQPIQEFSLPKSSKITVDGDQILITPLSDSVLNIQTKSSNYNIEFSNGITYINTEAKTMLKLQKINGKVKVYLIGFQNYQSIRSETK